MKRSFSIRIPGRGNDRRSVSGEKDMEGVTTSGSYGEVALSGRSPPGDALAYGLGVTGKDRSLNASRHGYFQRDRLAHIFRHQEYDLGATLRIGCQYIG